MRKPPDAIATLVALALIETEDCIEWPLARSAKGYGRIGGASVHSVILAARHGPRPPGGVAMHGCDNPPCLNYRHLSWGTPALNSAQMVARGRSLAAVCTNGHPFTPENTLWWGGRRRCRTCRVAWEARRGA